MMKERGWRKKGRGCYQYRGEGRGASGGGERQGVMNGKGEVEGRGVAAAKDGARLNYVRTRLLFPVLAEAFVKRTGVGAGNRDPAVGALKL